MKDSFKTATAGEDINEKAFRKLTKSFPDHVAARIPRTVQPKSDVKHGAWVCIDCGAALQNNAEASGHTASHRRGWWTGEHVEQP